ncbi:ion transporter [Sunxiuqinia elliptica]|nr:ion transporter [Sunxiuqinia elliptica]
MGRFIGQNLTKEAMLKEKIYRVVNKGAHGSKYNLVFDYGIMLLIILNVVALAIGTVPEIRIKAGGFLRIFELISIIIFTIEYLMRLYVADLTHPSSSQVKSIFKFVFSGYGMIDLVAILPFYLPFLIAVDMRFLRLFRLMRFFRLMKLNRYNSSLNLIWSVVKEKRSELAVTGFVSVLILLISSFLMYDVESKIQPDKFPNIFATFWWAIATLTTVGYGDVYPITAVGKVISSLIAILGIGIVALPTGIISAGFMNKIDKKEASEDACPHCGKEINRKL